MMMVGALRENRAVEEAQKIAEGRIGHGELLPRLERKTGKEFKWKERQQ